MIPLNDSIEFASECKLNDVNIIVSDEHSLNTYMVDQGWLKKIIDDFKIWIVLNMEWYNLKILIKNKKYLNHSEILDPIFRFDNFLIFFLKNQFNQK